MGIYISILLSSILFRVFLEFTRIKEKELVYTTVMGVILFIIPAFRDFNVGADTINYITRFNIIANTSWNNLSSLPEIVDFELGYIIYNKIISMILNDSRFFLFITTLFIVGSFTLYIYRKSENVWFSFFLFISLGFWGDTFNLIRQMMAIAILLPAIDSIQKNKFLKFSFFVILASTFHVSVLSFFAVYPLSKLKINKKYISFMALTAIITYIFSRYLIFELIGIFGYTYHLNRIQSSGGSGNGMFLLLSFFLFLTIIYNFSNIKENNTFMHILIIAIMINILSLTAALFGRAMVLFTIHNIITVPNLINSINNKYDRLLLISIVILVVTYYYLFLHLSVDGSGIVPYVFFYD